MSTLSSLRFQLARGMGGVRGGGVVGATWWKGWPQMGRGESGPLCLEWLSSEYTSTLLLVKDLDNISLRVCTQSTN